MSQYLLLTNNNEVVRVASERIAYIVSDRCYSAMVLTDGEKHVFTFNLATFHRIIEQQLDAEAKNFIRLGKRLIVNGKYIYYINISKQQITLSDISFTTKFTLAASKQALRTLKASLEENLRIIPNH
ncbi:hypothetical protein FACS1894159_10510 [Bacteroidia bacterium]|nr:hypothetical protein FACS1894159_10510 [Bacteroidia bacterium]